MENIPVTFEYEGKEYKGHLSAVSGAGNNAMFHLNVDGYHWGQLANSDSVGWRFTSNTKNLGHLSDYFAEVVMLWYQ